MHKYFITTVLTLFIGAFTTSVPSVSAAVPTVLFLSAGPNVTSAGVPDSAALSAREQAIEHEFSCINNRKQSHQDLDWDSVCYTPPASSQTTGHLVDVATKPMTFELGTDLYSFTYKEPIFNLKDKGLMYGIFGTYTLRPTDEDGLNLDIIDFYQVEGRFDYGKIDYQSTPSGTIDGITDYTFELRGLLGKDVPFGQFVLTPYMGFGYRYLNDDTGGMLSSTGAAGYERESRYIYLPIGAELAAQISSTWKISFKGEYDVFLQGEQTSKLSDANTGLPDIENDQESGFGYRASARLTYNAEKYEFFIEPFIRYWHIDDSEVTVAAGSIYLVAGMEPENKTTEVGGRIGIKF